ncbi:ABC transporter permease [Clostridium kluyveri]|uniref:Permease n=1 Tax=Clostridium kluyveri TaxID=1534 RepID=A0A1L5F9D7_CLOKL|nr:ABC transporter permease [Clostridium kluyveri]APM39629.1 permease [Clostridium kluyveri]
MILNKRILREFKDNIVKYIGMMLLVLISSMAIVGFANSSDCIIESGREAASKNNIEDGNFEVKSQLNNGILEKIRKLGVTVDENFYVDYKINDNQKIRLFKERKNINKVSMVEGENSRQNGRVIIDTHFGEENNYTLGSSLEIGNKKYIIEGYAAAPDYTLVIEKLGDVVANSKNFGIGFLTSKDFIELKDKKYSYTFKLNGISYHKVKNILQRDGKLISFINSTDNPRINGYMHDSQRNKNIAVMFGFILFIMIAFMISMSIINNIDKESPTIGALYALGYIKKELLRHFMILPIIIVSLGAIAGTCIGFIIEASFSQTITTYYSLPVIRRVYPPYLFFTGIVVPVIIVIIVNYKTLSERLKSSPLQLLRREKKQNKLNTIKIKKFKFITKFRLREFLREIKGNIILFCGMSIATFLLVFGIGINTGISTYVKNIENESKFEYTYILKLPIEITENKRTEKTTFKNLSIYYKILSQDMDIVLQGIKEDTNFYDFKIKDDDPGLYISESIGKKFGLQVGDFINLKDTTETKIYNLKVKGTVKYSSGLYVFMNQKQLNSLINESKYYFNGYISKDKLNINEDYIYSFTTNKNVIKSAKSMTSIMLPMIVIIIVISTMLFVISLYLLLKLMIDKSTLSISLVKIFGFNKKEIDKLYLSTSLYTVIFTSIVAVPLSYIALKAIYPSLIANMQSYLQIGLTIKDYCFIAVVILGSYFTSITLLKKYINKISLSEALMNRD